MSEETCPLCGKNVEDILRHFVMVHDIEDLDHLEQEIKKAESVSRRQRDFSKFVEELKEKLRKGIISLEDYRSLISEWSKARE
jgi:hypothetical protein